MGDVGWDLSAPPQPLVSKWLSSDGLFIRDRSDSDASQSQCTPINRRHLQLRHDSLSDPIPFREISLSPFLVDDNIAPTKTSLDASSSSSAITSSVNQGK